MNVFFHRLSPFKRWIRSFLTDISLKIKNKIIAPLIYIITRSAPGPALVSSEIDQGALEQATGRVLRLRIEGPCTEGYYWIRIQN